MNKEKVEVIIKIRRTDNTGDTVRRVNMEEAIKDIRDTTINENKWIFIESSVGSGNALVTSMEDFTDNIDLINEILINDTEILIQDPAVGGANINIECNEKTAGMLSDIARTILDAIEEEDDDDDEDLYDDFYDDEEEEEDFCCSEELDYGETYVLDAKNRKVFTKNGESYLKNADGSKRQLSVKVPDGSGAGWSVSLLYDDTSETDVKVSIANKLIVFNTARGVDGISTCIAALAKSSSVIQEFVKGNAVVEK